MPDDVLSAREALEKAFASSSEPEVAVEEAPAVEEVSEAPEVAEAPARERDERGRFAPKAAEAEVEPEAKAEPAAPDPTLDDLARHFRQHPEAAALLGTADPRLRAALQSRLGEMEKGIGEYREQWDSLRRYDEMARAGGTTLAAALEQYTQIEQTLARNPIQGLEMICANIGLDLRQVAAHVAGKPYERDAEVASLQQRLAAAERELNVHRTQHRAGIEKQVHDFFAAHPRANDLWRDMQVWINNGFGLEDAYRRAEALNPDTTAPAARTGGGEPPPEPRKQPVSVRGAPSSGSHPVRSTEVMSLRDALERAAAATR